MAQAIGARERLVGVSAVALAALVVVVDRAPRNQTTVRLVAEA